MATVAGGRETGGRVLAFFLAQRVLQFLTTAEYSVFPASSIAIRKDLDLTQFELGLLGTLTYAGITVSSVWSGWLFGYFGAKRTCIFACVSSFVCCTLTVFTYHKYVLLPLRFVTGLVHGPLYVYFPVWIDLFAPPGQETRWMGAFGVTGAVGNLSNYALTAYLVYTCEMSWRVGFSYLAAGDFIMCILAFFVPDHLWKLEDEKPAAVMPSMFKYPAFWLLSLVLALNYYVCSGVEYFGLQFVTYLGSSPNEGWHLYILGGAGIGFGIIAGSQVVDYLGGYSAARRSSLMFSIVASTLPVPLCPWLLNPSSPRQVQCCVSLFLMCYAATVPAVTGLALRSVPIDRTQASGYLQFLSTSLGFMVGPALVGTVADKGGIHSGWHIAWLPALTVPFLLTVVLVLQEKGKDKEDDEEAKGEVSETSALVGKRSSVRQAQ